MPKPIKHRELVRRFRKLGWHGPYQKGKHPFLVKDETRLTIPNPHEGDIDWSLTKRILKQAGITTQEWERLA
jgi:predicted RNA binding protein YcfA (HicA-like mRNA interferase family)